VEGRPDAELHVAGGVLIGDIGGEGVAEDDGLGDGKLEAAGLGGVGLGAGEVLRVDGGGEGIDLGGGDGRHEALEVSLEGRVVLHARVGEDEALVGGVADDDFDVAVDALEREGAHELVGEKEAVDVGAPGEVPEAGAAGDGEVGALELGVGEAAGGVHAGDAGHGLKLGVDLVVDGGVGGRAGGRALEDGTLERHGAVDAPERCELHGNAAGAG